MLILSDGLGLGLPLGLWWGCTSGKGIHGGRSCSPDSSKETERQGMEAPLCPSKIHLRWSTSSQQSCLLVSNHFLLAPVFPSSFRESLKIQTTAASGLFYHRRWRLQTREAPTLIHGIPCVVHLCSPTCLSAAGPALSHGNRSVLVTVVFGRTGSLSLFFLSRASCLFLLISPQEAQNVCLLQKKSPLVILLGLY